MAKTRRLIRERLPLVDAVIELLDARIPASSANPEIASICANKPMLTLLNKCSLADPGESRRWITHIKSRGRNAIAADCSTMEGIKCIEPALRSILSEKIERNTNRGMASRPLRAMVVGIPNVGKSSLFNRLCGGAKAKVEDRPGVTLRAQWSSAGPGLDLLDMPGVLWPKFDDPATGRALAYTGAIKDAVLDTEELAADLCALLWERHRPLLCARYNLDPAMPGEQTPFGLLELIARRRGFLVSGGEADLERAAAIVLDEFRGGKVGRITLENAPFM